MPDILDVFDMTPMQAGMLFQSLYDPAGGAYVQQYWGQLDGPLDGAVFRDAWAGVIARHEMLRAQCHWQDLDHPAFAVHAKATPDWQELDWRGGTAADLDHWLAQDRARGFAMDQVPLMRFALIRLAPEVHVFVWTFHHLLMDGWCGALAVREVLDRYAGVLPVAAPVPFREYLDWRKTRNHAAAETYWRAALAGVDGPTPLGIDRADTGKSGQIDQRFQLDVGLTQRLVETARKHRVTLATVMQGVWGLILSRYAGQEQVVFGMVLAGRPADLVGAETMIGLFLNTVPVRVDVASQAPVWKWMNDIQSAHRLRETHGHVALSDLQSWAGLDGSTALFDSLLIVETYPESIEAAAQRNGAALRLSETGLYERTNFPLVVKVLPGTRLEICLSADAARIPAAALAALQGHLNEVLNQIAEDAGGTLGDLDILTPDEHKTLADLAQGPRPEVTQSVLDHLLARAPDGQAVVTPDGTDWTHGDLMARAAQIATTLRGQGIGRGDVVAICQDRTADLLASLIAVWRCGAAYLPLDPIYPAERIAYILQDAGAALALTDATGRAALGDAPDLTVVMVGDCWTAGDDLPDHVHAENIAYILYTSGSTGRPKGVPIPHQALANFIASMARAPGLSAEDRLLAVTTVAFDISALELFGPLVAGGVVVIAPSGAGVDGTGLARMLEHHRITVKQATPAGWRVLRDSGWAGRKELKMLSGGEALDSALARDLMQLGGALWNLYGPTETTIWSGALEVTPDHLSGPTVPVGGPLDNTTLHLRDANGRLAPMGVPGELWIGGLGLSPGYLNRPDQNAERFVHCDGARAYRTGDQMRRNPDGTLAFLGRLDGQVKLRGYRIELGEVEKQLMALPGIAEAVVLVRGTDNTAQLVGYLRGDDPMPQPAQLRADLAEQLPSYMIPTTFVSMAEFPLTPNGKIDRKAFPEPKVAVASPSTTMSERDMLIAGIWADALGVNRVGSGDDFFALGGHSLSALRVITEVRRLLGVELSLRDLFDATQFAAFCDRVTQACGAPSLPPVIPAHTPVLSAAQNRLWVMSRLHPDRSDYHLSLSLRLSGELDIAALTRALGDLSRRHSVLRSRFPALDGLASVEILPEFIPVLHQDDQRTASQTLSQIRQEEAARGFDIATSPPWRARLVTVGPTEHVLILTLHHILADEWSFGLLRDDLVASYRGDTEQPDLTVHYSDFAHWQRALDLSDQRAYWARQLGQAPALTALPLDRPRTAHRNGAAGRVHITLDLAQTEALEAVCREHGATLFMGLLAAYAVLLHRHSGETDLLIATPVTNRRLPEFQNLVGLFVNTLAIRADAIGDPRFSEVLAQMRETVLGAHANQDLPFEHVLDQMNPPRDTPYAPLAQTFFSMSNAARAGSLGDALSWEALPSETTHARFDLSLSLSREVVGLQGHFEFAADVFETATVTQMARRFETLLAGIADAPESKLSDLPVLTEADHELALPIVSYPSNNSPEPRRFVLGDGVLFDERLLDHLTGVAQMFGEVSQVATGCPPGSMPEFLAQRIATLAGVSVETSGPNDAIVLNGDRRVTIGPLGDPAAEVISLPELPGAFLRDGDALRPAPGVRAIIVSEAGALVPPGMIGRLAVGGAGLALGYVKDAASSAQMFLPNPHADPLEFDPAETCLIHTQNFARLLDDGRISLCDAPTPAPRLSGETLDFAAIEATYTAHPTIALAAVPAPSERHTPERLDLVLQSAAGAERLLDTDLRKLASGLPTAARPSTFHWRDDLPLDAQGQPDRAALWRLTRMGSQDAPQGDVEKALARLWAEVLGVPYPGRHDGFFDLGGDSIRAVQIAARLTEDGLRLDPRAFFDHQSIAALARCAQPMTTETREETPDMDLDLDLNALAELVSFGDD